MTTDPTPITLAEIERLEGLSKEGANIWNCRSAFDALPALLASARRLLELESALRFLHDNGDMILKAATGHESPWERALGIDPIAAAMVIGWKAPGKP